MKITIDGHIVARQYDWETAPHFEFVTYDPETCGFDTTAVKVMPYSIDVDVPDEFDMRPHQIKKLEQEKEKAKADFAKRVKQIDDKINSLLAIENHS